MSRFLVSTRPSRTASARFNFSGSSSSQKESKSESCLGTEFRWIFQLLAATMVPDASSVTLIQMSLKSSRIVVEYRSCSRSWPPRVSGPMNTSLTKSSVNARNCVSTMSLISEGSALRRAKASNEVIVWDYEEEGMVGLQPSVQTQSERQEDTYCDFFIYIPLLHA